MRLEEQIDEGIRLAMKAQDKIRLITLRNVKRYIIEAKKAAPGIDELPDSEVIRIIQKLSKRGIESAAIYKDRNRNDLYEEEMGQVEVLKEYLPRSMDDAQLTVAVRGIIARTGATSMKEMGSVMGIANKELSGKAESKDISAKVKELLSQAP